MEYIRCLKYLFIHLIEKIIKKSVKWGMLKYHEFPNEVIKEKIISEEPFCLVRPGSAELSFACWWKEHELLRTRRYRKHKAYSMLDYDEQQVGEWVHQFENDLKEADIYASFSSKSNYIIDSCCTNTTVISANVLNLGLEEESWLWSLKGKRVLIVSPFADTMQLQMNCIDKIWGERDHIFKHIDLDFQPSVWYTGKEYDASGFSSWFDAYDYLKQQTMEHEFDIALLSCGPFSSFLAADIKRAGKQAIQYGGVLQLLFGIRGKRWDNDPGLMPLYNEYWVRPSHKERPVSSKSVELMDEGCYW